MALLPLLITTQDIGKTMRT